MSSIEAFAPYEGQTSCDPSPKPGVQLFRDVVLSVWGGTDLGIVRDCELGGKSEHKEGRAWDWGIPEGTDVQGFLDWVLSAGAEVARRAGIMYLIYNREVWRSYKEPHWERYTGKDPHDTHIHISFSKAGGSGQTSLYQGSVMQSSLEHSNVNSSSWAALLVGGVVGFMVARIWAR